MTATTDDNSNEFDMTDGCFPLFLLELLRKIHQ